MQRLSIVTGGIRGIGFEVYRQMGQFSYRVILAARDPVKGPVAAQALADEGLPVLFHQLDSPTRPASPHCASS